MASDELVALESYAESRLQPAGVKGAAVALARLFVMFPLPHAEGSRERKLALETWHEALAPYPADVLERAVMATIRRRKYSSPPTPGDVIEHIEADQGLARRRLLLAQARRAQHVHRMRERTEAMWTGHKAAEAHELERLRRRVALRQDVCAATVKRVEAEPELTEAEAEAQRDRDVARFLAEMEG